MFKSKLLFLLSMLAVVAVVVAACGPGSGSNGGGVVGQTVKIEGGEFFYLPVDITAKPGEVVKVNFKNTGTVQHTLVIKDLNFKLTAQPGQSVTGAFTAPATTGSHEIHCDVAGHTEAGMQGKLNVVAVNN